MKTGAIGGAAAATIDGMIPARAPGRGLPPPPPPSPKRPPAMTPAVTVMRFSVSVPVLSLQMVVAPPIVSHAARKRTRLLSFIIFWVE